MKPLNSDEIRGSWSTVMLPINADDSIDYGRLVEEIDILVSMRTSGIYSNGTTGEFYNQTEQEFDRISLLLAERCNVAGVPFQIGVSHMSPKISMERLQRVVALKPSAVQVTLPDWFPVTDEEAIAFLQRMAEIAGSIGMVLYNPPHAKRVLQPEEFGRLSEAVPSLVGVKVADGDAAWYAAMRKYIPKLSVFVPGHHLASGYRLGAYGSYSNIACLHPLVAQRWYDLMTTDINAALKMESRIDRFMTRYIRPFISQYHYPNHAVDKLLAAIGAWADIGTRLRWPYRWIPQAEADRIRSIAREVLPEFFPQV